MINYADLRVISGVFQGMKYPNYSMWGAYFPKLLGTYEKELFGVLKELKTHPIAEIVVIGADDGYYPVGLSLLFSKPVAAFEKALESESSIAHLSGLNKAKEVSFQGTCFPDSFRPEANSLILMDIEGDEVCFLDSCILPHGQHAYWIIEVHGEERKRLLMEACYDFFTMNFIGIRSRTLSDLPVTVHNVWKVLFRRYWMCLLNEWRGNDGQSSIGWLILQPK